tara:strand:+ start:456 stop:1412 length:957 start_codon:yes stop_codon:yes gene_type:complete
MKIKRRDLVHLIREMSIDEMAYMGMPNIQKGKKIGSPNMRSDSPTRDIEKIGRFFKSKNWNKKADKFYTRAFPNSNVWVIPQIGSKDSEELQFDKEESGYTIPVYAFPPPEGRGVFYSISEKLLRSLGMPEEEIAGVNFVNDIIFVPRVERPPFAPSSYNSPKVGKRNFSMATPHMLIHALFDGGILSKIPEVERARMIFDGEDVYNEPIPAQNVLPGGDIEYVIPGIEPKKSFIGMKAPITAALRDGSFAADGGEELANEVFAGALLYRGLERIVVAPELEKWVYEKTGMGVKKLINSAIEASREHLKGKIVAVDVF